MIHRSIYGFESLFLRNAKDKRVKTFFQDTVRL